MAQDIEQVTKLTHQAVDSVVASVKRNNDADMNTKNDIFVVNINKRLIVRIYIRVRSHYQQESKHYSTSN